MLNRNHLEGTSESFNFTVSVGLQFELELLGRLVRTDRL